MNYQHIITERHGRVGLIRFNRPNARNALCIEMITETFHAVDTFERSEQIGALVVTGDDRAFAAGADIGEMARLKDFQQVYETDFAEWGRIARCRKPVIAAVAGYALGGGCELAMSCDFILAAENARFGQPEITVGTTPGCGGTQRLPRAIGKAKAMEMCLTGRLMDAVEAERMGLVARILPIHDLVADAIRTAGEIAAFSQPVSMLVKECVNRAFESSLAEGMLFERRAYHACFSVPDRQEAMNAFVERRRPRLQDR